MSHDTTAMTSVILRTPHGPVRGARHATGARFLGIPYARPPVGKLRFASPVPPAPWTDVLDATSYGPTAQRRPFADVTTIPEPTIPGAATLNLNVFTPDPSPTAGLPVLVWIHGGGFVAGSAASPWYDGGSFNRDGIVLVSLGYRLGVEGFLHLPDAPDNRGVRDWIAALEWVRDTIGCFGGDPAKVTIAGQSAGGGAVQTLLATPTARGLFRAAISASGAVMEPQDRHTAEAVTARFTRRTGVPATAAALQRMTDADLLVHQDALTAPAPGRRRLPTLALAPFADGELIPQAVPDALTAGDAGADVPLMAGFTAHEFNGMPQPGLTDADLHGMLADLGLDDQRTRLFLDTYADHASEPGALCGHALTDRMFRAPALAIAEARARRQRPTWLYQFPLVSHRPGSGVPLRGPAVRLRPPRSRGCHRRPRRQPAATPGRHHARGLGRVRPRPGPGTVMAALQLCGSRDHALERPTARPARSAARREEDLGAAPAVAVIRDRPCRPRASSLRTYLELTLAGRRPRTHRGGRPCRGRCRRRRPVPRTPPVVRVRGLRPHPHGSARAAGRAAARGGRGQPPSRLVLSNGSVVTVRQARRGHPRPLRAHPGRRRLPRRVRTGRYGEGLLIGYRWYDTRQLPVAYPFGHGLSYTAFAHSDLTATVRADGDDPRAEVTLTVTNTGERAGTETVRLYVTDRESTVHHPARELRAFARVRLEPGHSAPVTLTLGRGAFAFWHEAMGRWTVEGGEFALRVGASSRDIRLETTVELTGETFAVPLHADSTAEQWLAHPAAGPWLRELLGTEGFGAILFDPHSGPMIRAIPLARLARFPGFPLDGDQVTGAVAEYAAV
ncbi:MULTISPECIES: carboxylesterase family protein [unclassified Streptomyces]|uniref:carboxylesterase family protein n=1 Tax=unclassified Streptomyces TaxID=2593676 RepID=UPI0030788EA6